jgi:hypothetical protein
MESKESRRIDSGSEEITLFAIQEKMEMGFVQDEVVFGGD